MELPGGRVEHCLTGCPGRPALAYHRRVYRLLLVMSAAFACGGPAPVPATPEAPAGGAVAGVVVDAGDGAPLGFATVRAWSEQRERGSFTTSSDGRFQIEALPPGRYQVIASYSGRRITVSGVEVQVGATTELAVTMPAEAHADLTEDRPELAVGNATGGPLGAIEGQVVDRRNSEPMPGAVVSATSDALPQPAYAVSDEQGRFRFAGLRPGTYTLTIYYHLISRGNIEIRRGGVEVVAGETTAAELFVDIEVDE